MALTHLEIHVSWMLTYWVDRKVHSGFSIRCFELTNILANTYKIRMPWREVAQSCLTLCDPMDCSLPGSSVHGIFQAGVLEWAAIAFSAEQTACTQMLGSLLTTSMPLNKLFNPYSFISSSVKRKMSGYYCIGLL